MAEALSRTHAMTERAREAFTSLFRDIKARHTKEASVSVFLPHQTTVSQLQSIFHENRTKSARQVRIWHEDHTH